MLIIKSIMVRVLQVVDHMSSGGIQAFIMNVYRNIDREVVQFDFLLHHKYDEKYCAEIKSLGGVIYYVTPREEGIKKNIKALKQFFDNHKEYQIVHMHESSLSYITPLRVARDCGVRIRCIHSHSSNISSGPKSIIHRIFHWWNKKFIYKIATDYIACGDLAAKWMFGGSKAESKCTLIYNGISVKSYEFNENERIRVRKQLGLSEGTLVLGHVGRFNPVKNHRFLLGVTKEILNSVPDTKLILVGDGPTLDDIKEWALEIGIADSVLFLGVRSDVNSLLQVMDVFLLPSFYEGYPVSAIEAQASGLPIIMSDSITKEAIIKDNVLQKSIQETPSEWAAEIMALDKVRQTDNSIMIEKGLDISSTISKLMNVYGLTQ